MTLFEMMIGFFLIMMLILLQIWLPKWHKAYELRSQRIEAVILALGELNIRSGR